MSAAGVVAALSAEARTLGPASPRSDGLVTLQQGTLLALSGIGPAAAAAAARALVDAGAAALVSWGMAGGLDPVLTAGTLCLPERVIDRDGNDRGTDPDWRGRVHAALAVGQRVVGGTLLTSPLPLHDVPGKAAAFRETGAVAVDMESLAVAEVAAAHRLPFLAVRAIVDTAGDALPDAVLAASGAGQVQISRLVAGLLRSPGDLWPLLRLAGRYRAARRALAAAARSDAFAPRVFAAAAVRSA